MSFISERQMIKLSIVMKKQVFIRSGEEVGHISIDRFPLQKKAVQKCDRNEMSKENSLFFLLQ